MSASKKHGGAWFPTFARKLATWTGRSFAFFVAIALVLLWGLTGPLFGFSDTWQLVINTSTTIITFLMVFLIQHTQNRDTEAMQLKLDELIRSTRGAHNAMLELEALDEEQLTERHALYSRLAERAREQLRQGAPDDDTPEIYAEVAQSETRAAAN
ncbi:MAG: low affinity iron permease family protein [Betaproteobacteria bacterium]